MANAVAKISTLRRCTFTRATVRYNPITGALIASGFPCYTPGPFIGYYGIDNWEGTTNLLDSNKSHPTTTTGFTALNGAAISIDTVNGWVGGIFSSLKVVTPGVVLGEGVIVNFTTVSATTNNTGTIHIKGSVGAVLNLQLTDNIDKATATSLTLTGDWQEISVTHLTDDHTTLQMRVYTTNMAQAITFYIDGNQLEQKSYATPWHLGGLTRKAEALYIPSAGIINPNGFTVELWFLNTAVTKRQIFGQYPIIFNILRGIGGNGVRIYHSDGLAQWIFRTTNDVGAIKEAPIDDSLSPDGWTLIRVTGDYSYLKCYINNGLVSTIPAPTLPSTFGNIYIGSQDGSSYFLNTTFGGIRFSSIARTDTPSLLTPLPVDDYTTGYYGFNNSLKCDIPIPGIKDQDVDQEIIADEFTLEGGGLGRVSFANSPRRIWNFSSIRTPKRQFDSLAETLRLEGQGAVDFWSDEFGADTNTIKAYVNLLKRKRSPAGLEGNWRDDLQILNVQVKEKTPL
jgi:hypothetical protein